MRWRGIANRLLFLVVLVGTLNAIIYTSWLFSIQHKHEKHVKTSLKNIKRNRKLFFINIDTFNDMYRVFKTEDFSFDRTSCYFGWNWTYVDQSDIILKVIKTRWMKWSFDSYRKVQNVTGGLVQNLQCPYPTWPNWCCQLPKSKINNVSSNPKLFLNQYHWHIWQNWQVVTKGHFDIISCFTRSRGIRTFCKNLYLY